MLTDILESRRGLKSVYDEQTYFKKLNNLYYHPSHYPPASLSTVTV